MRKDNSEFKTKFISEAGSFLQNADYFAFVELQDFACYCIADGIDDEKKRKSAELAISSVINSFYSQTGMSKRLMKHYASVAHKELLKESHDIRLEASILILVTNYKKFRWVNVGNVRLHHIRNNKIINSSKDQSLSQNMAEQGEIPLDMIAEHEERHNLYCYLGMPGHFKPYVSPKIKLEDGDILTLCTRGIWENTGVPELLDAVEESSEPEEVCANLEDIILSQRMKWISNYTIACIYVNKIYKNPKREKIVKRIVAICIPILLIAVIFGVMLTVQHVKKENKIKQMWMQIEDGIVDMQQNGKILEDTNTLKQGAESYNGFQSSEDANKKSVKAAKPYIEVYNMLQDVQEKENKLEAGEEIEYLELYKDYARVLAIAKGKKYINNKLKEQDMDGQEDYEVSISGSVDLEYLNEEAKASFENIITKYEEKFDNIMLNAKLENVYNETNDMYDKAVDDDLEYISSAKKNTPYNFNNNEDLSNNIRYLENQQKKYEGTGEVDQRLESKISSLLSKLNSFKNSMIGAANEEIATDAEKKGQYSKALNALEKAEKAYKDAGNSDKANVCKSVSDEIEEKIKNDAAEKEENAAYDVFNLAEELLENEKYESAKTKYQDAKKKFAKLKDNSMVQECNSKITKIENILNAQEYEKTAEKAKEKGKYEEAKEQYDLAYEYYTDAGETEEAIKMKEKGTAMEEKTEESNLQVGQAETINQKH